MSELLFFRIHHKADCIMFIKCTPDYMPVIFDVIYDKGFAIKEVGGHEWEAGLRRGHGWEVFTDSQLDDVIARVENYIKHLV